MNDMIDSFNRIMDSIRIEVQAIDMDECDISIEQSVKMIDFLKGRLGEVRNIFLSQKSLTVKDEIKFFKEMKPEVLSMLLYFNKVHNIELRRPNGSDEIQREYYEKELFSLTFFFERNLDFYQYYRAGSTHLDEYYFVRGKFCPQLCIDSTQYILDPLFSTGYDYKVSKIISNEMLRIYLNKRLQGIYRQAIVSKNRSQFSLKDFRWTGTKTAIMEIGFSLHAGKVINDGNVDIKDIMLFLETIFDLDLGDYYRAYITIKNRKKDRTPFLKFLIDSLEKRMDMDDIE